MASGVEGHTSKVNGVSLTTGKPELTGPRHCAETHTITTKPGYKPIRIAVVSVDGRIRSKCLWLKVKDYDIHRNTP